MKSERIAQDQKLRNRRRRQIHPDEAVRRRIQPAPIQAGRTLGLTVPMDEDRQQLQSPTLTESAACAAARRATGIRYGEALT